MASADPIRRVSVLSTGTVVIHPEQAAVTWKPTYQWLFTSRRWTQPLPVNAYVIEHRDGLVLFDTGQDRASVIRPSDYYPGGLAGLLYRRLARFDIGPPTRSAPSSPPSAINRTGRVPLLLVGDLTYDAHLLEHGHVPGVGARRQLRETTAMVNALRHRHPGMVILAAHDPGASARLASATGEPAQASTGGG